MKKMSLCVPLTEIEKEKIDQIRQKLTFTQKLSYFNRKSYAQPEAKTISFYSVSEETIKIPMNFARQLGFMNNKLYDLINIHFFGEFRDYQIEPLEQALESLLSRNGVILDFEPGFGKTIISAYFSSVLSKFTLVIYPRVTLQPSWLNTFNQFTDASIWDTKQKIPDEIPDVILSTPGCIKKIPQEWRSKIGLLVLDESHLLCRNDVVEPLLTIQPSHIVACSGTHDRDKDNLENMTYALTGKNIVHGETPWKPQVYKVLTQFVPTKIEYRNDKLDWEVLINSLFNIEKRQNYIVRFIEETIEKDKAIILVNRTTHADILYEKLKNKFSVDRMYKSKKKYDEGQILIGTVNKIGTGFDEAMFCENFSGLKSRKVYILFSTKKPSLIFQAFERSRHENPVVFHFVDDHSTFENHWKKIAGVYRKKAKFVKEIEISFDSK